MPNVLLIETSATIRQIEKNFLIKAGYEVETDNNFKSAVKRFRSASEDAGRFDAVILGWTDSNTPELAEIYSLLENPRYTSLPILTLAHELEAGISTILENRPNVAFLLWEYYKKSAQVLTQLLSSAQGNDSSKLRSELIVQPIRVLFVDDSRTVRKKYSHLLNANGYYAETASCADEGMQKALKSPFDIAIIDYFMPDATGDVLCKRLRDHKMTAGITTALITGTYHDEAIKKSLEAGATECMFKNESDDLFLTRIDAMSRHIRAHNSIEKERERLSGILRSVGEGVYGVDAEGHISFVNPACREILGYQPEDRMIGKLALSLFHYADEEGNLIDEKSCFLHQSYREGQQSKARETLFWDKFGRPIPVECTVYPLTIGHKCEGSVVAFRDISDRKLLEEELRWQARHDTLTKLHNRRYFEEQLAQEVIRLRRSDETSALLYLDLDRFKYINDTAGHAAGDRLLIDIANQMTTRIRKSDMLARLGGDEFAIILRNISNESVNHVAEDFREMLDQHMFVYNDKQYKINGTIGIALIDRDSQSAGEILANADIACHIAKGEGRNRSHLFVAENDSKDAMDLDLGWSSRLHNALLHDHFFLHAQPIIPLQHIPRDLMNTVQGPIYEQLLSEVPQEFLISEVLLRMNDSAWGMVMPGVFLPTAERFNMMDKIDLWVIKAALNKLSQLQQSGYTGMFTINLSGQTIANKSLIENIEQLILNIDVDVSKVILEITETSAVSNLASANELISRVESLGCRFALDDFGSGFSSFSHLKNMPVDFVKIDGSFVVGAKEDPGDRAIVQSINDIAHSLGKKTIAEYVENAEVLQFLYESGVDFAQGHFISPAMDISHLDSQVSHAHMKGHAHSHHSRRKSIPG